MVHSRYLIELAKILLEDKWYTTHSLRVFVGDYIKPEIACRRSLGGHETSINAKLKSGQTRVINKILNRWYRSGLVNKRKRDTYNEWLVKDKEYFGKILKEVKSNPMKNHYCL